MVKELLSKCEDAINGKPCGYCGKMHRVSLSSSGMEPNSVVTYGFSDDACQEYQRAVKAFIVNELKKLGYPITVL